MAGSVGHLRHLAHLLVVFSALWQGEVYGTDFSLEIRSYFRDDMIVFEFFNESAQVIEVSQVPWRGEHQPSFVACRKPDLLLCVNATMPFSTVWPYKYKINPGATINGGIYIDSFFADHDELRISSNYVVVWYFESDYGNFTGVVQKR